MKVEACYFEKFHPLIPFIQSCFLAFVAVTTPLYLKLACLLIISQAMLMEGAVKLDLWCFTICDPGCRQFAGSCFSLKYRINVYLSCVLYLYLNMAVNAQNGSTQSVVCQN